MAKSKTDGDGVDYKALYDDQKQLADALNAQLAVERDRVSALESASAAEQETREDVFRLIYTAGAVMAPCHTKKLLVDARPRLRQWVGEQRAEEIELGLRR